MGNNCIIDFNRTVYPTFLKIIPQRSIIMRKSAISTSFFKRDVFVFAKVCNIIAIFAFCICQERIILIITIKLLFSFAWFYIFNK